jgi:hypothetical protein
LLKGCLVTQRLIFSFIIWHWIGMKFIVCGSKITYVLNIDVMIFLYEKVVLDEIIHIKFLWLVSFCMPFITFIINKSFHLKTMKG